MARTNKKRDEMSVDIVKGENHKYLTGCRSLQQNVFAVFVIWQRTRTFAVAVPPEHRHIPAAESVEDYRFHSDQCSAFFPQQRCPLSGPLIDLL